MAERGVDIRTAIELVARQALAHPGFGLVADGPRVVDELARTGDQRDRADHAAQPVDRPDDLEIELRHAVAVFGKRKALEDDIGEAAIGRGLAGFLRGDERVGFLRLTAVMDAHRHRGGIELAPVDPNAPDEGDRPLAEADREIGVVAVGRFVGLPGATALAAALAAGDRDRNLLLEARRPDQLATEPRTTVEARDRRALGGGEPVDLLQARPVDDLVAAGATEPGLVDRRTGQSAQRLSDRAAGRAAERGAQRRARDLEKKRRHQSVTPGKEKAWLR